MPAKKMGKIKKNVTAPREKSMILEDDFRLKKEELSLIKKMIKKGAVFIVLGSEYTYTKQFYKGLNQLMYAPTFNGAAIYDSHYKFANAFDRPYVTIALNDPCNTDHKIDNIKLLDRYRSKTLYTVIYEDDNKEDLSK